MIKKRIFFTEATLYCMYVCGMAYANIPNAFYVDVCSRIQSTPLLLLIPATGGGGGGGGTGNAPHIHIHIHTYLFTFNY